MREALQLRLGLSSLGNVLMGPGDAADLAFRTVHRSGRDFDVDQRAILAQA
jgi:hypothetical protein